MLICPKLIDQWNEANVFSTTKYQREYVVKLNKISTESVVFIKGKCKVEIYFEDGEIVWNIEL